MAVRVAQDVFELMLRAGCLRLRPILRHVQPALDQLLVRLEMELQSIRLLTVAKRLVGACRRARQVHGTRGQVERVRVPLEYVLAAVEVAAQTVGMRGR